MVSTPSVATLQIVTFSLNGDRYATDIAFVERVLRHAPPRAVPNTPSWLKGVIDYQGRVVPVLDLRARFELEAAASGVETRVVVFDVSGQWVAAIVDAVHEVTTVPRAEIEEPPPLFRGLTREYVTGLIRRQDSVIVLLDAARLLTSQERLVLEDAAGGSSV